jgi:hypothetical protein
MPQLLGRLMAIEDPAMEDFLDAGRRVLRPSALLTRTPLLPVCGIGVPIWDCGDHRERPNDING